MMLHRPEKDFIGTLAERMRAQSAQLNYLRSFAETAVIVNMSKDTLRRLIAKGGGPKVTRLSARKIGILDSDREAWLAARAARYPLDKGTAT